MKCQNCWKYACAIIKTCCFVFVAIGVKLHTILTADKKSNCSENRRQASAIIRFMNFFFHQKLSLWFSEVLFGHNGSQTNYCLMVYRRRQRRASRPGCSSTQTSCQEWFVTFLSLYSSRNLSYRSGLVFTSVIKTSASKSSIIE